MPLPAALAAKLSKRGLITPKQKPAKPQETVKKRDFKGLSTCPNKSNIYHECNYWCDTHWQGVAAPDPTYLRKTQKLLGKYPLPMSWTEIFDHGTGRYYYWNMENDLVSWLPPKHPKSIKCQSAAKLRENRLKMKEREECLGKEEEDENRQGRKRERERDEGGDSDEEDCKYRKYSDRRDRERNESRHCMGKTRKDGIDPMDPAAYSDVPHGSWSDGLDTNKTRAATTEHEKSKK